MIGKLIGLGTGARHIGTAVEGVAEVFVGNRGERDAADHERFLRALAQHSEEFTHARTGWFDALVNGLNRLPRPMMAVGTLGLFAYAMVEPDGFAHRMQGLAFVPEPLWWLLGAVVSFYFGARELHHYRGRKLELPVPLPRLPAETPGGAAPAPGLPREQPAAAPPPSAAPDPAYAPEPDYEPQPSEPQPSYGPELSPEPEPAGAQGSKDAFGPSDAQGSSDAHGPSDAHGSSDAPKPADAPAAAAAPATEPRRAPAVVEVRAGDATFNAAFEEWRLARF